MKILVEDKCEKLWSALCLVRNYASIGLESEKERLDRLLKQPLTPYKRRALEEECQRHNEASAAEKLISKFLSDEFNKYLESD
jgi:hypothetical protein